MKKILSFVFIFAFLLGFGPSLAYATATTQSYSPSITLQLVSGTNNVTLSVSGELGVTAQENSPECAPDGYPLSGPQPVYTHPATAHLNTIPANSVKITSGPAPLLNTYIPITITPGADGDCFTAATRSSYSGSRTYDLTNTPAGTYEVIATIMDDGGSKSDSKTLTVSGGPTPPPPLTVECYAFPNSNTEPQVADSVEWRSVVSGGISTKTHSWTGSDGLSGSSSSVTKAYTTEGPKDARLTVVSGDQTATANCAVTVKRIDTPPYLEGYHDGYEGLVTSANCAAYGWAYHSEDPYVDVSVRAKNGNTVVKTGIANAYRSDVAAAGKCGDGRCAFNLDLNGVIPYMQTTSITVEALNPITNEWNPIGTTPRSIKCAATTDIQPSATLTADPNPVPYGTASILTWGSSFADSCTGTNFSTGGATSGSVSTGNLTVDKTYRVDCIGPGGSDYDIVTVTVGAPNPNLDGACQVTPSPASVGQTVTWSASATGATGNYDYLWTGAVTGYGATKTATYNSTGTKTATVEITSGTRSITRTCSVSVGTAATTGTIIVSSNLETTWELYATDPEYNRFQTTPSLGRTYTNMVAGEYQLSVPSKVGYSLSITPSWKQNLPGGQTISFIINYAAVKPTVTLTAAKNPVAYNNGTTITWASTNATSCTSTGAWTGGRATGGTWPTGNLTSAKTYSMYCTGPGGVSDPVSLTIGVLPRVTLTANPVHVAPGAASTLTWTTDNAGACAGVTNQTGWLGIRTVSGSQSTGPLYANETYKLLCGNEYGQVEVSAMVAVGDLPSAPTLVLDASPKPNVPYGTPTSLTWRSENATSCTASSTPARGEWSGAKATYGDESSGNLTTTTTFRMLCSGPGGWSPLRSVTVGIASAGGTVTVRSNIPTTWMLLGSPQSSKTQGSPVTLATYTDMEMGNYSIFPETKTGYTYTVSPAASQYLPAGGTVEFLIEYTLTTADPVADIWADDTSIPINTGTILHWSSVNATSCSSPDFNTNGAISGTSPTGNLTGDKTYNLICSNEAGKQSTDSVTIYVDNGNALRCIPTSQTVNANEVTNFSASGGSGAFSWRAAGGVPAAGGNSNTFSSKWSSSGTKVVTVDRGPETDTCEVNVMPPPTADFSLSTSGNISSGRFGTSTETIIRVNPINGFNKVVNLSFLSVDPALSNASYTFDPVSLNSDSYSDGSAFRVVLSSPVPEGRYTITVRGTASGPIVRTANVILTVGDVGPGVIPPYEEF